MNINLEPIISLSQENKMRMLEIRNEEAVRKWMYNDHIISVEEHLNWIDHLKEPGFAIFAEKNIIGSIRFENCNYRNKTTSWTYHLTQTANFMGLAPTLEFAFIDFCFDKFIFEKLNCEVIEGNDAVIKLHSKFLFKDEGFRRSNILKNGIRLGVHYLGLLKSEWLEHREEIKIKYARIFDKFNLTIPPS